MSMSPSSRPCRGIFARLGLAALLTLASRDAGAQVETPLPGEVPAVEAKARGGSCDCAPVPGQLPEAGVVYRGSREPGFEEILRWCAPGLWFSPDEPLLLEGRRNIPSAHPCDEPSERPVVYWQLEDVLLRGPQRVTEPVERDSLFFRKTSFISLLYFFYYPKDVGMGGHMHDIEGVRMAVRLEESGDGCRQVRIELIEAFAHGLPWYSNRLNPTPDLRFPVMLFVEEGKHASCPDRNAAGSYTPGYDTNQFVNDAWGVRDVFGSGHLFTGAYQGWMTKYRHREQRVFPPVDGPPPCIPASLSSLVQPDSSLGRYELRSGMSLGLCDAMGTGRDSSFLRTMMVTNGLGAEVRLKQYDSQFSRKVGRIEGAPQLLPGVALKWDEGALGVIVNVMGINVNEGWLVPRVKVVNGAGLSLMWTRSAARWSDAYFLGGWEWRPTEYETVDGNKVVAEPYRSDAVWETGMKVRVGLPEGWIRWLFLNYRFAGVRTGIRFNGVDRLKNARLSFEIGAGVW